MSFRNRTGLFGLLIGSSLAIASACGGLSDVKIIISDDAGGNGGHPGGGNGDGSSGKGGGKPSGGDNSADSGAGGVMDVPGAGAGGAAGEGGDGGEGGQFVVPDPMPGPPTVTSISPRDQATDADPRGAIRIYFSEPLDGATVTPASVQIKDAGGNVIEGPVTYADAIATFVPKLRMNLLGTYTVNVSTAITDAGATPMERPFMSTFMVRDGVWGRTEGALATGKGAFGISIPVLATDGGGRAIAVWAQESDTGTVVELFAAQYNGAKGWGAPVKVNTNAVACQGPSVSMNASGNVIVGWREYDSAITPQSYSVQVRRLIAGNWDATSTRVDVASTATYTIVTQNVAVAMAANGHAHVAWSTSDSNTTTTPAVSENGVMARHADAAGSWDASVTPLSQIVPASGVSAPALSFDGDSNGFATYQLTTGSPAKTNTLMFRFTTKWGTSAVASGLGDGPALPVAIATNAAGDGVASWVRTTAVDANTTTYDVMASSYNRAWNAPVVVSTAKTALPKTASLAATWTGASFLVAWSQSGGTPYHIYATEYKGTAWGTTTIVSDGNHSSFSPSLTGDGRGHALAVWYQTSDASSTNNDIVFSRFLGAKSTWSEYGRVTSVAAPYLYPQAVTLADGTVLATWPRQPKTVTGVLQNDFQ